MQKKILIATSTFAVSSAEPLDILKKNHVDYILNPYKRTLTGDEVIELAKDCTGIISGSEPLDKRVLTALPRLKGISRVGIGLDNIDLGAAENLGIRIKNTPDAPTRAVGELTVALILDLARGITAHDRDVRNGVWRKKLGYLLLGKKVGIIGLGRIGRLVAELLVPFGARVYGTDLYSNPRWAEDHTVTLTDINGIITGCDFITVHIPPPKDNSAVIGEKEIRQMKKGVFLLNLSRGGVVDENALYHALKSGHVAGAAIDTFNQEPYHGPLTELDSVILTPHMGSNTYESRQAMELEAAKNLVDLLK